MLRVAVPKFLISHVKDLAELILTVPKSSESAESAIKGLVATWDMTRVTTDAENTNITKMRSLGFIILVIKFNSCLHGLDISCHVFGERILSHEALEKPGSHSGGYGAATLYKIIGSKAVVIKIDDILFVKAISSFAQFLLARRKRRRLFQFVSERRMRNHAKGVPCLPRALQRGATG